MDNIEKIKIGEEVANFKDTTSGYIARTDQGKISPDDTGWISGNQIYQLING